jgi:large subunit ribosomal protein L4
METKLLDKNGKEIGTVKLTDKIFNQKTNEALLWENITGLQKNKRKGHASTKSKNEVRGGGRKPYRQKGIGWARHGTIRSPIWRGGGVTFGPKPRDYSVDIPKKKKKKALLISLSAKAIDNRILVVDELTLGSPKTKEFAAVLKNMQLEDKKTLIAVEKMEKNVKLACRNIPHIQIKKASDLNCLDILAADYLLFTKEGLTKLEQRCSTKKS